MTENDRGMALFLGAIAVTVLITVLTLSWAAREREEKAGQTLEPSGSVAAASSADSAAAAVEASPGASLYMTCTACHGAQGEGNAVLNAPRLAGQEAWYLKRQIENFRSGARGSDPTDTFGAQMKPMVAMLADDAAIDGVVAHVTAFPVQPAAAPTLEGDPSRGQPFYATCSACHGPKGEGNALLNAPRIAGQEDWYLFRQLQYFRDGVRGSDPADTFGMQMKPMVATVNGGDDQSLMDLAVYISSLQP